MKTKVAGAVLLAAGVSFFSPHAQAMDLSGFRQGSRILAESTLPSGKVVAGAAEYQLDPSGFQTLESNAKQGVVLAQWPEGRSAAEISFLHTFSPGVGIDNWRAATALAFRKLQLPPDWPVVMSYEAEYADGVKVAFPVRFGEGIESWYRVQTVAPMLWARDAWVRLIDQKTTEALVLYSMTVPNPRPDKALVALRALPAREDYREYGTALILSVKLNESAATGRIIVVDRCPVGDDRQAGTFDAPFGSVQHALDAAQPGDTVLVRGGLYPLGYPLIKKFTGVAGKWLTISAFPGETSVIDASGLRVDPRKNGSSSDIGQGVGDSGVLHVWGDPRYTRIQGLHLYNSDRAGISCYGKTDDTSRSKNGVGYGGSECVEILFNTVFRTRCMGIISHQTNRLRILGNRVIRPHSAEMSRDDVTGEQTSSKELPQEAIDLSRNKNFEVAFNTVIGGRKEAIDCISVEDGSIHHNYIDSCLNGIYIDSWSVPILRLDIHHNFIRNAFNGIPLSTEGGNDLMDFKIHHNISTMSKSGGISIGEATYKAAPAKIQNHQVFNNTIHAAGGHAMAIGWQSSGVAVSGFLTNTNFHDIVFQDNIITETSGRPMSSVYSGEHKQKNILFTHNLVWPTADDTTPGWVRTQKGWKEEYLHRGEKTIVKDPLYMNPSAGDFRLRESSAAICAGVNGADLGAIPFGQAWIPGLDFAGTVTAFYQGSVDWKPLDIPRSRYTMYRDSLHRPSWFQRGRYGPDFINLPDGEQSFSGVTFYIEPGAQSSAPNALALAGAGVEISVQSISGLPVGRKAAKLAFCHNADIRDLKGLTKQTVIFHYRVNYSDGSFADIPVRFGMEVDDWLTGRAENLPNARIGWTQEVSDRKSAAKNNVRVYVMEWSNPKPADEIASIDILRDVGPMLATPAVFAISAGN